MKRFIVPVLILLCIGFIGFVFYTFNKEKEQVADPYTAVGTDATFIIRIKKFHEVSSILSDEPFRTLPWAPFLHSVVSRISSPERIPYLASEQWIFIQGSDPAKLCAVIPVTSTLKDPREISGMHLNALSNSFNGTNIYTENEVSGALVNGLLMISNSSSLLESCILQSSKGEATETLQTIRRKAAKDIALCFFAKNDTGDWFTLELQPSISGQLLFTGTILSSSSNRFDLCSARPVADPHLVLPEGAVAYEIWNFENAEEWHRASDAAASDEKRNFWSEAWQSAGDSCRCDLNAALLEWKGSSYATLLTQVDSITVPVAAYAMADSINLSNFLGNLATNSPGGFLQFHNPGLFDRYTHSYVTTEHLFGFQYRTTFYASPSEKALQWVKNKLDAGEIKTIYRESSPAALILSGEFLFHSLFPQGMNSILEKNRVSAQFRKTEENTIICEWTGGERNEPALITEPVVTQENVPDSTSTAQAEQNEHPVSEWTIVNHTNREKETFRQNDDLSIELIGSSGKSLWKTTLKEKIVGNITQIDVYKNGKLQMAFATEKSIYILDRNGKSVGAFPLRLKDTVSGGLYVFDYDNTKTYRLIVSLKNGAVLNFNTDGLPTTGWKYKPGKEIVEITLEKNRNVETLIMKDINGRKIKTGRNGLPL